MEQQSKPVAGSLWTQSLELRCLLCLILLHLFCARTADGQVQAGVRPPVPEGRLLVEIAFEGDYLQLEQITGRLQAQVVRLEHSRLFLIVDQQSVLSLRQEGLNPRMVNQEGFFQQYVRVEPPTDSLIARLREVGGQLVQREDSFAVFRVTLRQLNLVQREGIQARKIEDGELLPRFIEINASDDQAVALIISEGVYIFEARDGTFLGQAFDYQIDALSQHGLEITVISPPFDEFDQPRPEGIKKTGRP